MALRRHRGFTLVELLVVITIIGMLMTLVLPAVNAVRENARRTQCANQMQQIAKATFSYVTSKDYFPGYRGNRAGDRNYPITDAPWAVAIAPQLERSDIKDRYGELLFNNPERLPYVDFLVCPSDPKEQLTPTRDNPISHLAYVVNAGRRDRASNQDPPDKAANGLFHDLRYPRSPKVSMPLKDGNSNTLMLSENLQATKWSHRGDITAEIREGDVAFIFAVGSPSDFTDAPFVPVPGRNEMEVRDAVWKINGDKAIADPGLTPRPSSNHPGGVNVAFCDGRTMFLSQDIGYWVYQQLMTPDGARSDVAPLANKQYILNSADYTNQ